MNVHPQCSFFEILPDDALLAIGSWVVATGAVNLAQCLRVNRRLRSLWGQAAWLEQLLREEFKNLPAAVRTLEQWALWEAVREAGLEKENRIGFDYASLDIAWNDPRNEPDDILDSQQRLQQVGRILKRFPNAFARIESHCGTGAPLGIAGQFSVARGRTVVDFLLGVMLVIGPDEDDAEDIFRLRDLSTAQGRLFLTPWGRQIALLARESPHPYGRLARMGKGWVELYVCHGPDLEMPERPDFYRGQNRHPEHDERANGHVDNDGNLVVYFPFHNVWHEAPSDGDDSNNSRSVENMGMIEDSDDSEEEE